jgi:hypothetical protein
MCASAAPPFHVKRRPFAGPRCHPAGRRMPRADSRRATKVVRQLDVRPVPRTGVLFHVKHASVGADAASRTRGRMRSRPMNRRAQLVLFAGPSRRQPDPLLETSPGSPAAYPAVRFTDSLPIMLRALATDSPAGSVPGPQRLGGRLTPRLGARPAARLGARLITRLGARPAAPRCQARRSSAPDPPPGPVPAHHALPPDRPSGSVPDGTRLRAGPSRLSARLATRLGCLISLPTLLGWVRQLAHRRFGTNFAHRSGLAIEPSHEGRPGR